MSERDLHDDDPSAEGQDAGTPDEVDPEAPEADAAEQRVAVRDEDTPERAGPSPDADEADAAEQHRVVSTDEEDYR